MGKYRSIPFVPDVKADLSDYVVEKGMDSIFYYLAKEEAAIRRNPVKQTRIFSNASLVGNNATEMTEDPPSPT